MNRICLIKYSSLEWRYGNCIQILGKKVMRRVYRMTELHGVEGASVCYMRC